MSNKSIILNDTHMCVRNSSDIFIDYKRRFYEDVLFPYMKEHGITHILHDGDYAEHRKHLNVKGVQADREHFLDKLVEFDFKMDVKPGNHDVYYKNTNKLCSLDIVFSGYEDNVTLHHDPTILCHGEKKLGFIPWITTDNYAQCMEFLEAGEADIILGHFEIAGFEISPGVESTHGMDTTSFKLYDKVLSGHFHKKSVKGNVMYLGSQFEFTWADAGDPKFFHVLDWDTGEVEAVRVPLTIYKKMYYNDELVEDPLANFDPAEFEDKFVKIIVVKKTNPYLFDKYIDLIQEVRTHDLKIIENFHDYAGDTIEEEIEFQDTSELLNEYVDAVDTGLDRDRLKSIMQGLYVDALNRDIQ